MTPKISNKKVYSQRQIIAEGLLISPSTGKVVRHPDTTRKIFAAQGIAPTIIDRQVRYLIKGTDLNRINGMYAKRKGGVSPRTA